jgi:hypothetical protein
MGKIVKGCQIYGPMPFALNVTESPVEVKELMEQTLAGDLCEVHMETGASAWFDPRKVTALAPLWEPVDA